MKSLNKKSFTKKAVDLTPVFYTLGGVGALLAGGIGSYLVWNFSKNNSSTSHNNDNPASSFSLDSVSSSHHEEHLKREHFNETTFAKGSSSIKDADVPFGDLSTDDDTRSSVVSSFGDWPVSELKPTRVVGQDSFFLNKYLTKHGDIPEIQGLKIFKGTLGEGTIDRLKYKKGTEDSCLFGYDLLGNSESPGLFISKKPIQGRQGGLLLGKFRIRDEYNSGGTGSSIVFADAIGKKEQFATEIVGTPMKIFSEGELKYDFVKFYYR